MPVPNYHGYVRLTQNDIFESALSAIFKVSATEISASKKIIHDKEIITNPAYTAAFGNITQGKESPSSDRLLSSRYNVDILMADLILGHTS